jgi:hypothetical protein
MRQMRRGYQNFRLTQDSIRDTHGNHGATATSNNCAIALPLLSTYPTMPHHLHLQTPQLHEQRQRWPPPPGKNNPRGRAVGKA